MSRGRTMGLLNWSIRGELVGLCSDMSGGLHVSSKYTAVRRTTNTLTFLAGSPVHFSGNHLHFVMS